MEWQSDQPRLQTARLELRALELEDAPALHRLASAREVAATTLLIPHPYPPGAAEEFILGQEATFAEGRGATFGIFERSGGALLGCTGIGCDLFEQRAEMGYWLGVAHWGQGYATEAAERVLGFGFAFFRMKRVEARCFVSNPASARVLEKIGMQRGGVRPRAVYKEGRGFEDVIDYALASEDWGLWMRESGDSAEGRQK